MLICGLPFGYTNIVNSFAFNAGSEWHANKDSSTLRIMTWNVQNFFDMSAQSNPKAATRLQMLRVIADVKPDILCLQEYRNIDGGRRLVSVRHELDSMGFTYNYCTNDVVIIQKKRVMAAGSAIFSRRPLLDTGKLLISKNILRESLAFADVQLDNKPVRIYTAHLTSFALYGDTTEAFDEGEDIYRKTYNRKNNIQLKIRETEVIHEQQIALIKEHMKTSPYAVLYCGDMNSTPAGYNYHYLKGDLQDAFLEKGSGLGATFYQILPTLRIDICFADNNFDIRQCAVIPKKLSDHYPVVADVTLKQ